MESKSNLVQEKSYAFALRIVKLYLHLIKKHKIYPLADQIIRCGTSIGANIEEAIGAHSKKDFISKLIISYKECREVIYWLKLLRDSVYLDQKLADSLINDSTELLKIITSIIKTSKSTLTSKKIINS